MTVGELIEMLTEQAEAHEEGLDTEVRVAYQENYPLAGSVSDVTTIRDDREDVKVIWLAVGEVPYGAHPYAPRSAWLGGDNDEG